MSCPDLQTGWVAAGSAVAWNGFGWEYAGYPGSDIGLVPAGGWEVGFTPTQVQITVVTTENWTADGMYLYLWGDDEYGAQLFYQYDIIPVPVGYRPPGTYILTFDLTDPAYLSGAFMDIKRLVFWFGLGDGPADERSFTITDITFSPCPGAGCTPFWTNLIGQREIEP